MPSPPPNPAPNPSQRRVCGHLARSRGPSATRGRTVPILALALAFTAHLLVGLAPRSAAARGLDALEDAVLDDELDAEDLVGRRTGAPVLGRARGGSAWLSVVGYAKEDVAGRRDLGGAIVLGIPLERAVQRDRRDPRDPPFVRAATAMSATQGAGPEMPVVVVSPRVARGAVAAAWRAAGLGADDARLDALASRARWAAILPETRLRATRYNDERLTTDASLDSSRLRDSAGANLGLEARLTWRLDRLVFADDEPTFERMRADRHDARSRVAGRVLDALFHWHRASLELASARADAGDGPRSRDEMDAALRVAEAEVTLDVLTAGWFTAWRAANGPRLVPVLTRRQAPDAL